MKYRPEIDGLRTLAVIPVILFHAGYKSFSGGFVGVDIFFVISGFLITNIIYRETQEQRFSIITFYERRIRRIMPALIFVSVTCLFFGHLWMLPGEHEKFSRSIIASNLFASNILFWRESGYFDQASELKPMLHTWSLAVEEQFYIVFPLVLMALAKVPRTLLILLLGIAAIISLGISEWMSTTHIQANFYLPISRAWELGSGALLAIGMQQLGEPKRIYSQTASITGLLLILFGIFTYDKSLPFPGIWAIPPVLGSILIIGFATEKTIVGKILSWKPIVGIGLISYSAYLWHQPLFAFARIRSLTEVSELDYLILTLCSLALAYLTWRFVEQPFRQKSRFTRNQVFLSAGLASTALILIGFIGVVTDGLPGRNDPKTNQLAAWELIDERFSSAQCNIYSGTPLQPNQKLCQHGSFEKTLVLWGDSHALAVVPELHIHLEKHHASMKQLTASGCMPILGYEWDQRNFYCQQKNSYILKTILNSPESQIVIVHGRWGYFFDPRPFDNGEGGISTGAVISPVFEDFPNLRPDDLEWPKTASQHLANTLNSLISQGKRLVLVYPVPEAGWDVPIHLARKQLFNQSSSDDLSTRYDAFVKRNQQAYIALDKLGKNPNILRIYPEKVFCNSIKHDRCMAQMDGLPLYSDEHHLSKNGAALLANEISNQLKIAGWLE